MGIFSTTFDGSTFIDGNIETSIIRVKDMTGRLYDITITNRDDIQVALNNPNYFTILPDGDITNGEVSPDSNIGEDQDASIVTGRLINRGVVPKSRQNSSHFTMNLGLQEYDTTYTSRSNTYTKMIGDEAVSETRKRGEKVEKSDQVKQSALHLGPTSLMMKAQGGTIGITKDGLFMGTDGQYIRSKQEIKPSTMYDTGLNLLDHYFIGIANTVILPMPHMVDVNKLVSMGKFVSEITNSINTLRKKLGE